MSKLFWLLATTATRRSLGAGTSTRVLRGGSFNNNDNNVRCAARNHNNPNKRNNNIGFRIVLRTPVRECWKCMPGSPKLACLPKQN
ncbi:MAG: SUMF1/EgtB/PvdO family nonheme iron enzyme [Bacteroidota bacterium]